MTKSGMSASEIRESFLAFFKSKQHKIVNSASLLPESPNLLFTNAGMNQFVPIFLGERIPQFRRAADTQKCIRAGGKHNDLDDVGFDTYHHTFFEMLGNWSFGDFFKKEAIEFAWELLTKVWHFPKGRLYVTVYSPDKDDPAKFDEEAYRIWENIFIAENINPLIHIKKFGKKDNFWMMGETGPCGPCTEIHIDLTANGDTNGELVNKDSPFCMEIWNLVFMQFNASADGRFEELSAKYVDTGMGLERIAGIINTTKNFTDFSHAPSNYNSDLFNGIFKKIEQLSGKFYTGSVPKSRQNMSDQENIDFGFRVLADHIRALTFAIGDGILPSNEGRHYVLRRILRRAVIFAKRIDMPRASLSQLAEIVINDMLNMFPELLKNKEIILRTINAEELMFEKTLDRGVALLEKMLNETTNNILSGENAFLLYDTYGFPLDLTQLIASEHGIKVDEDSFKIELAKQRERARKSQKKTTINISSDKLSDSINEFIGYDLSSTQDISAKIVQIVDNKDDIYIVTDRTPFYAEMGGQVGDSGTLIFDNKNYNIVNTIHNNDGNHFHIIKKGDDINCDEFRVGESVVLSIDLEKRKEIQRHHTATHLLHAALVKVLGSHIKQSGSYVSNSGLRFDFNHFAAMSQIEIERVEKLVNAWILENMHVTINNMRFKDIPEQCVALFNEKYGETVRVVSIENNGIIHSMELCGGCHVHATGELGYFKIIKESAIAAGIRRLEAMVGYADLEYIESMFDLIKNLEMEFSVSDSEILRKITQQKHDADKISRRLKCILQKENSHRLNSAITNATVENGLRCASGIFEVESVGDIRSLAQSAIKSGCDNVIFFGNLENSAVAAIQCSENAIKSGIYASDIAKGIAAKYNSKGGGSKNFGMVNLPNRIENI